MTRNISTGGPGAQAPIAAMHGIIAKAADSAALGTASGAAGVLATGGDYLKTVGAAVSDLDHAISTRTDKLAKTRASGGTSEDVMKHEAEQIDLLQKLRDRMALSMERIAKILAGPKSDETDARRRNELQDEAARIKRLREQQALEDAASMASASPVGGAGSIVIGSGAAAIAPAQATVQTPGAVSSTSAGDHSLRLALRGYGRQD